MIGPDGFFVTLASEQLLDEIRSRMEQLAKVVVEYTSFNGILDAELLRRAQYAERLVMELRFFQEAARMVLDERQKKAAPP